MLSAKSLIPTVMTAGSVKATPITQSLANRQIIEDFTAQKSTPGITRVSNNKIIQNVPIPPTFTVTIKNTNEEEKDIKLFNNGVFEALPGGVTATYNDGFAGKLIDRLINVLSNANGLLTYGFNVIGTDANGEQSNVVLNTANLQALYYTGKGKSSTPFDIDISGAERNTQYEKGLLTVKQLLLMNFLFQLSFTLGAHCQLQFVFFTGPIQD